MAYTLGGLTLPRPHSFTRDQVEISTVNTTLTGRLTKDIRNQKEQFVLGYRYLTQTEVTNILAKFTDQAVIAFAVSDGSLTIPTTNVHVDINKRTYSAGGSQYREDLTLVLTEEV